MTKVFVNEGITLDDGRRLDGGHIYYLTEEEAQQVWTANNGSIGMDSPEVEEFSDEVEKEVEEFKLELREIEVSIDPRFKDPEFKQHHIDKLKAKLQRNVFEIQAEYTEFITSLREAAAERAAGSTTRVDSFDQSIAKSLVDEIAVEAKMHDADAALDRLERKVKYMSDKRKTALSFELPRLLDAVNGDEKLEKRVKAIYGAVKPRESVEEVFAKATQALPDDCTHAYTVLTITHPVFKDEKQGNVHSERKFEVEYKSL